MVEGAQEWRPRDFLWEYGSWSRIVAMGNKRKGHMWDAVKEDSVGLNSYLDMEGRVDNDCRLKDLWMLNCRTSFKFRVSCISHDS